MQRTRKGGKGRPREDLAGKRLFLIDGHSQCYQAYYALPPLTAPDGRPVQVVYGVLNVLFKLLREEKPDLLAFVMDAPGPTFRHERYEAYKANRPAMPDDLRSQIDLLREVLDALEIPAYQAEGYEADDLLGTIAVDGAARGGEVFLVTNDKDARQLLSGQVRMYDSRSGEVTTPEALREKYGIAPEQVADYLALVGDRSDNVPGVPGVGPKRARDLLAEYGDVPSILDHIGDLTGKLKESFESNREQLLLSRELVELDRAAPVDWNPKVCAAPETLPEKAKVFFEKLGFRRFLREMAGDDADAASSPAAVDVSVVRDDAALAKLAARLRRAKGFAVDTETTSEDPIRAELVGISLSHEEGKADYVPVRAPEGKTVTLAAVRKRLGPLLADPEIRKIGQNLKYDVNVLARHGIPVDGIGFDTMLASYCANPSRRSHALDALAVEWLDRRMTPITELIGSGRNATTMDRVPVEKVAPYAGEDAEVVLVLEPLLRRDLARHGVEGVYDDLEIPLLPVLARMERTGIRLDAEVLAGLSKETAGTLARLEKRIHEEAGTEFNVASPVQLREILFDRLGLRVVKRTKTGPSTDQSVLEELAAEHPLPELLLEHRGLAKIKSTYLDALPDLLHPVTGRIHTTFSQTTAATGRLSSRDPNLQNIPIRTELGRKIRAAFLPLDDTGVLLSADYSQIELRVLAHVSGDDALREAFEEDADIHRRVAAEIHDVGEADVTPTMRGRAKTINFAILYGRGPFSLSRDLGVPVAEAKRFIDAYFDRFPKVRAWKESVLESARERGEVRTLLGRRRPVPEIRSPRAPARQAAERVAVNTVVQGGAADLIKKAMLAVSARIDEIPGAEMLLQIHDELLLHVPEGKVKGVAAMVTEGMRDAMALDVPLRVDVGTGRNWAEAHP